MCLEILRFSSYSSDASNSVERTIWRHLIAQALREGGLLQACDAVQRVASALSSSSSPATLPLDFLCLLLEQAAQVREHSRRLHAFRDAP